MSNVRFYVYRFRDESHHVPFYVIEDTDIQTASNPKLFDERRLIRRPATGQVRRWKTSNEACHYLMNNYDHKITFQVYHTEKLEENQ